MNKEIIRKIRFFGAWQDEKEEAWLGEMAGQGYHLEQVGCPLVYCFVKGSPRRVAYRLDYTSLKKGDRDDYLQLFQDASWEWVGEMASWQYFRRPIEEGEQAEIYTDNQSKIEKYRRVLLLLVVIMPTYVFFFRLADQESLILQILTGFMFLIMVVYVIAILKLIKRIRELEKNS